MPDHLPMDGTVHKEFDGSTGPGRKKKRVRTMARPDRLGWIAIGLLSAWILYRCFPEWVFNTLALLVIAKLLPVLSLFRRVPVTVRGCDINRCALCIK